eukprot:gene35548-47797_t
MRREVHRHRAGRADHAAVDHLDRHLQHHARLGGYRQHRRIGRGALGAQRRVSSNRPEAYSVVEDIVWTGGEDVAALAKPGDVLVVLGSPWAQPGYAARIAEMRERHGLRFALLVHDIIPLRRPEWCFHVLVRDFTDWFRATLPQCDHILANSRYTAADVERLAGEWGLTLPQPVTVPQIGEFSFILVGLGLTLELVPKQAQGLVVAGALISIAVNPLVLRLTTRLRSTLIAGLLLAGTVADADQYRSQARVPEGEGASKDLNAQLNSTNDPYAKALLLRELAGQAAGRKDYEQAAKYLDEAIATGALSGPAADQMRATLGKLRVGSGDPASVMKNIEPLYKAGKALPPEQLIGLTAQIGAPYAAGSLMKGWLAGAAHPLRPQARRPKRMRCASEGSAVLSFRRRGARPNAIAAISSMRAMAISTSGTSRIRPRVRAKA